MYRKSGNEMNILAVKRKVKINNINIFGISTFAFVPVLA
jgi:hypothetical protein